MSNGQINYNLNFNANVTNAITNLNKLKESLNSISSISTNGFNLSPQLTGAIAAAKDLKMHLNNAFNVKTGNIDLNKFQASLAASNQNLATLSTKLLGAGQTGQAAFFQLQSGLNSANLQLVKSNTLLSQFAVTLKNTAKWQLSTTILQGFIGSIQKAYGYAQDLNESLNNIRIVTGQNTDQMAAFAEKANKAAKALSTTTTNYTNASLIYYQQGLSDKEVQERTNVTIKMANVTGDSAETVSDQMTAIWNNFYDGSDSLESFADKIVALGAATASSSDEIAQGLEKFAAVGRTVGLTYDYATAALATVVAETRQSADVVGTAFKTLFSRMEQLKQGGTTEDGDTTLGQYSQALANVGVNVKDTNGQLKDMDDILKETGAKWKTLGRDQQVALAQTVAGVRQYSQFIALMDNWGKVEENILVAKGAEGTLQDQANIYAESWEAAQKRVQASAETIYQSLLDDKFFIKLTNNFAGFLDKIDKLINSLGGLKGLLGAIAVIASNKLGPYLTSGIDSFIQKLNLSITNLKEQYGSFGQIIKKKAKESFTFNASDVTKNNQQNILASNRAAEQGYTLQQKQIQDSLMKAAAEKSTDQIFVSQCNRLKEINIQTNKLVANSSKITSQEKERLQLMINETKELADQVYESELKKKNSENDLTNTVSGAKVDLGSSITTEAKQISAKISSMYPSIDVLSETSKEFELLKQQILDFNAIGGGKEFNESDQKLNDFNIKLNETGKELEIIKQDTGSFDILFEGAVDNISAFSKKAYEVKQILNDTSLNQEDIIKRIKQLLSEDIGSLTENQKNTLRGIKTNLEKNIKNSDGFENAKSQGLKNIKQQEIVLQKTSKALGVNNTLYKNIAEKAQASAEATNQNLSLQEQYNVSLENTKKSITDVAAGIQSFGSTLTSIVSFGSQAFMSINMLSNAIQSLGDDSQTFSQKLSSLFMGLSIGLPVALKGFASVVGTVQKFTMALDAANQAQGLFGTLISANNSKEASYNTVKAVSVELSKLSADGTNREVVETEIYNILKKAQIEDDTASAIAKKLVGNASAGNAIKIGIETKAIEADTAATKANIVAKMLQFWWIGLIIAVVALLVIGIKAAAEAEKAEANAAKEAAEQVESLKTIYKETAEAANELKEAISNYDEALKTFEDLKNSGEDYADALKDVNDQAADLIEKYKLFGKWSYNNDGAIVFDEGVLEDAQSKMDQQTRNAQKNYYNASLYNTYAQVRKQEKDIQKNISLQEIKESTGDVHKENGDAYSLRKFTVSEIDDIGKAFSKLDDAVISDAEALEKALMASNDLTPVLKDNISAIVADSDHFRKLSSSIKDATEAAEEYARRLLSIEIENKYGSTYKNLATSGGKFDESKYNLINAAATQKASQNEGQILEDQEDIYNQTSGIKSTGDLERFLKDQDPEVVKQVLGEDYDVSNDEQLAITYGVMTRGGQRGDFGYTAGNGQGTILYNGEESKIVDEAARREIAMQVAQAAKNKEYENNGDPTNLDEFNSALESVLGRVTEDVGNVILTNLANGDLGSPNLSGFDESTINDIKAMSSPEEMLEYLGLTEEELIALGGKSAEDFYKGFQEGAENWDVKSYTENLDKQYEKSAEANDIDVEEFKEYRKLLRETYPEYKNNAKGANEVALANKRLDKGIKTLAGDWEDINEIMSDSNASLEEQSEIMPEVNDALKDMLNMSDEDFELLSPDFAKDNWDLIQDVMNNVDGAVDELRNKAGEDILLNVGVEVDKDADGKLDEAFAELNSKIASFDNANFEVGVGIDPESQAEFYAACNELINAAHMTEAQANAYFAQMGYDVELVKVDYPSTSKTWRIENPKLNKELTKIAGAPVFDGKDVLTGENVTAGGEGFAVKVITPNGSYGGGTGVKTGRGGSSSNKGGGGGGSSSERKTKTDTKGKEPERYHVVKKQLSALTQYYDDLNEAKDRAYGKDKSSYIEREIALMDQQIGKQKEYLAEIEKYRALDWNKIAGYGFVKDADGIITNYETIYNQELDKWKDAEARYNAGWIDDDAYDTYKEAFEEFEELLSKYEESNDLYLENLDSIVTMEAEKLAARLEGIEVKVTAEIDINEADLAVLEYLTSKIEDRSYKSVERLAIYGKQIKDYQNQAVAYASAIDEIFNNHSGESWQDAEMEALKEYRDSLLDTNSSLLEMKTTMQDELSAAFEEMDEKIGSTVENFDHYNSILDHYNSLVELYGKNARGFATGIAAASRQNALNTFMGNQSQLEGYKQQLMEAEKAAISANDAGDAALVDHWNTIIDELTKKVQEAQESVAESWSAALEAAATEFQTAVQDIIVALDDTLAGMYDDLDQLQDVFDKSEQLKENYLSTSQQSYELSKLSRQINNSMSDTMNLTAKAKLNSLLEKINKTYGKIGDSQEYSVKMSQYQLEYAQKEYDLLLAQIALEDAQDNKTQMKLVRDSSGNWNYAYTADQSKINEAQQQVEDKQNEIDQLNEQTLKDLSADLIENQRNWKEELAGLSETDFATKEEYQAEINRITDYYKENENYLVDQLDTLAKNMGLTGYDEIDNAAVNAYEQSGGVNGQAEATLDRLAEAYGNYENEILVATNAAGFASVQEALQNLQASSEVISDLSNETQLQIANDTAEMKDYLAQVASTLINWNDTYLKNLNNAILENEQTIDRVNEAAGTGSALGTLSKAASFASGGYTGEWADGGKLGILHQKELVLNEMDTSNLLGAAQLLRMIAPNISGGLVTAASAHASLLGGAVGAANVQETDNTIQQAVSIEASFPGVQSAVEIENALNDIVNKAAQYASIKKLN